MTLFESIKNLTMKKIFFFILTGQAFILSAFSQVKVVNLLTENRTNPIGIDMITPRFSWQLSGDRRNITQAAYELKVIDGKITLWNSGKISSDRSVHVPYAGTALLSGKKYHWQVRVWDNNGQASPWSETAFFQTALLNKNEWKAKWIKAGFEEDSLNRPAIYFLKDFSPAKKIASATAYITAQGMYEAQINGKRVGDAYLTPGWTSYNKRHQYQVYDVTNLLTTGKNTALITIGNGWYRGFLAWGGNKNIYGKELALLFQLNIIYA